MSAKEKFGSELVKGVPVSHGPVGFRAHLDNANLFDLVQLECAKNLKQILKIVTQGRVGFLYIDHGRVVHAECEGRQGTQVALEVLNWQGGSVKEVEKPWPQKETIRLSFHELVLQAVQIKDETENYQNNLLKFPENNNDDSVDKSGIKVMEALGMSANHENILENNSVLSGSITDRQSGEIFHMKEDGEELSATSAFVFQLAQLIGESFGMEEFKNLEAQSESGKIFILSNEEKLVGVKTKKNVMLSSLENQF